MSRPPAAAPTRLLTIINDILDFSKIESGKLELENHPFELHTCIEEALDLLAPKAAEKNLDLAYIVDDAIPKILVSDVTRLRQILVNLIGNAVKFTHEGEVVIEVTPAALEARAPSSPVNSRIPISCGIRKNGCCISRSGTPASAFPWINRAGSSNPSSRSTPPPPATTAAPAWDWPSPNDWPN